jgi:hypothetical protein
VTPTRRDHSRRVTPELLEFYKRKAHRLRARACRNIARKWLAVLARLTRMR